MTEVKCFSKNRDGKLNCQLPYPDTMVYTENMEANWKAFEDAYNNFATTTQLTMKDNKIQAVTLKTVLGTECQQILSHLELNNAEKNKPTKILEKLEEYFVPTRKVSYE